MNTGMVPINIIKRAANAHCSSISSLAYW